CAFFFFQAEDGIRDGHVTGVQTCALPIFSVSNLGTPLRLGARSDPLPLHIRTGFLWHTASFLNSGMDLNFPIDGDPYVSVGLEEIGRASCRERVEISGGAAS